MITSQRCKLPPTISTNTVKASFEAGKASVKDNKGILEGISSTWKFLDNLEDNQWHVTSFDRKNRLVCIELESCCGLVNHLILTLPTR